LVAKCVDGVGGGVHRVAATKVCEVMALWMEIG
jgi:hypothetical protein